MSTSFSFSSPDALAFVLKCCCVKKKKKREEKQEKKRNKQVRVAVTTFCFSLLVFCKVEKKKRVFAFGERLGFCKKKKNK